MRAVIRSYMDDSYRNTITDPIFYELTTQIYSDIEASKRRKDCSGETFASYCLLQRRALAHNHPRNTLYDRSFAILKKPSAGYSHKIIC